MREWEGEKIPVQLDQEGTTASCLAIQLKTEPDDLKEEKKREQGQEEELINRTEEGNYLTKKDEFRETERGQ